TVLLNACRSLAVQRAWGTGKLEARPDHSVRIPLAQAIHAAVRDVGHRHRDQDRVDSVLAVVKSFALRTSMTDRKGHRWHPPLDRSAATGRADSGDLETDLTELCSDVADLATDLSVGVAVFIDEMQDISPEELSALCAACHEISQQGAPLIIVGAGLPHLPVILSASKSYAERLFHYRSVDRLSRVDSDRALLVPASTEDVEFDDDALDRLYALTDGYPYFVQAYGKATWDTAPATPITGRDVAEAAPLAESELGIGFFGSRFERATPAEREYMRAMADLGVDRLDGPVATADVALSLGRRPQSLSPARDGLIKKGLVFAEERGVVRFTVPHFGAFLRTQR
ncbi:MAG: ATP-binding protein, partial [Propionibacteriales bacterium]|nr:ATP-binding protein [Propionibacteriales bacterium]